MKIFFASFPSTGSAIKESREGQRIHAGCHAEYQTENILDITALSELHGEPSV